MMTAIAIDDEPIALDIVKAHASKVPFINLRCLFTNAFDALSYLQEHPTDIIFLDIKMPDISGTDFVNCLKNPPMVIFTTAYSEHAVKSFELDAVDYLLKPFSLARFLKACNKAHDLYLLRNPAAKADEARSIFIKDGYEQIKVQLEDILYIEAAGNYTKVHLLTGKTLCTRISISDMLALLPAGKFTRTHRAYIVACNKITSFDRTHVNISDFSIPIGPTYAQCVEEF